MRRPPATRSGRVELLAAHGRQRFLPPDRVSMAGRQLLHQGQDGHGHYGAAHADEAELVEQAATRLDEQTVTINELRRQHGVLLDALREISAETTIDGTERDDLCAIIQGICRKAIAATTGGKA